MTGALAASCDITGGVTLATPDGGWAFAADGDGWTVRRVPAGPFSGPAVEASAPLLLEAASGRINPVPAAATRRLKVHDVGGLLLLAPIVQKVPGIPGGPILQLAARTMGGAGGMLGRLFRPRLGARGQTRRRRRQAPAASTARTTAAASSGTTVSGAARSTTAPAEAPMPTCTTVLGTRPERGRRRRRAPTGSRSARRRS